MNFKEYKAHLKEKNVNIYQREDDLTRKFETLWKEFKLDAQELEIYHQ